MYINVCRILNCLEGFTSKQFRTNIAREMQPSILQFFKPKGTPTKAPVNDEISEKGSENKTAQGVTTNEGNSSDLNKSSPKKDYTVGGTPLKRSADTDHPEVKKFAVTSRDSTPIKSERLLKIGGPEDAARTPNKLESSSQVTTCLSPFTDCGPLIKKKISAGAYALHENIGASWFRALQAEFDKPYFRKLSAFVHEERRTKTVFPPTNRVYSWTHHHDIKDTKVLILGQDPYHGPGQAHGLSFSVQKGVRIPPSLVNIFKELENDIPGFVSPDCGDLTGWAKQGVLMLNTCLTVNQGQANSHQNKGWETFTDAVISIISKNSKNQVAFLLWGRPAQRKESMIDKRHLILKSAHPSPLSAYNGFFGCAHFSKTNKFLKDQKLSEIDWKAL